jgi:hypothetical protein
VLLSIIISAFVGGFPLFVLHSDCAWGSDEGTVTEYEVKAAFLLNFVRFIDWPVAIKNAVDSNSLTSCDILFISSSEKDRLPSIMTAIKDLPILTVGEVEGFTQAGGIINFVFVNNKIRFEINPDVANQVGIHISAQLLQLARITTDH